MFLAFAFVLIGVALGRWVNLWLAPPLIVIAILLGLLVRVANAWEKFVVLRVRKLRGVRAPGFFTIIRIMDSVVAIIDELIQTTSFNAQQALTKDTVPVNADAIIFWHVHDAQKAAFGHYQLPAGD